MGDSVAVWQGDRETGRQRDGRQCGRETVWQCDRVTGGQGGRVTVVPPDLLNVGNSRPLFVTSPDKESFKKKIPTSHVASGFLPSRE